MTIKSEYMKERSRVQHFIRNAMKRGYVFPEDLVPDIPKRPTRASINRLRKLTPAELYKKAVYLDPETGESIPGTERRKRERSESSASGWATRRSNREKFGMSGVKKPEVRDPRIRRKSPEEKQKPGPKPGSKSNGGEGEEGDEDSGVADETYELIERMIALCDEFTPPENFSESLKSTKDDEINKLRDLFSDALKRMGEEGYIDHLKRNAGAIQAITEYILYKSSGGSRAMYAAFRDAVTADLAELGRILNGEDLRPEDNAALTSLNEYAADIDMYIRDEE